MLDDCVGDKQGSLRLSLSSDDCRFGFLLLHHDKVLSFLCVLLSNLLLLNGLSKLIGELQVSDRNIVKNEPEFAGSSLQLLSDVLGDLFSLCDKFSCIKLCYNGLQNLVTDRLINFVIVVITILIQESRETSF